MNRRLARNGRTKGDNWGLHHRTLEWGNQRTKEIGVYYKHLRHLEQGVSDRYLISSFGVPYLSEDILRVGVILNL